MNLNSKQFIPLGIASGCINTKDFNYSRGIARTIGFNYVQAHYTDVTVNPQHVFVPNQISFHSKYYDNYDLELKQIVTLNSFNKPVVVHPLYDLNHNWELLGANLILENLDGRSSFGSTISSLKDAFADFPKARWCFDIGHSFHVDPSGRLTQELIDTFLPKLQQVHLSQLAPNANHIPITQAVLSKYKYFLRQLPTNITFTLELSINQPLQVVKDQYNLLYSNLINLHETVI